MKLVHVTVQFQYAEAVEAILNRCGVERWVRVPRIHGRDRDGKHDGSQAFPGNVTLVQAQVEDGDVDALLDALVTFRDDKRAHEHLDAVVLPVERRLPRGGGPPEAKPEPERDGDSSDSGRDDV